MAQRILLALPLLSALAGSSLAQSTTVIDLVIPQVDQQTILASVVSVGPTATEYALSCPTNEDDTECGLGVGFLVREGPSTMEFHLTSGPEFTAAVSCVLVGNDATCTQDITGESSSHEVNVLTDYTSFRVPVTVTAGAELLSGSGSGSGSAAPTTSGSPSGSKGTTKLTGTATPTPTATGTGAGAGGSSSSSSKAGVPRITQNAVLAGVAAIVGGVAMI